MDKEVMIMKLKHKISLYERIICNLNQELDNCNEIIKAQKEIIDKQHEMIIFLRKHYYPEIGEDEG